MAKFQAVRTRQANLEAQWKPPSVKTRQGPYMGLPMRRKPHTTQRMIDLEGSPNAASLATQHMNTLGDQEIELSQGPRGPIEESKEHASTKKQSSTKQSTKKLGVRAQTDEFLTGPEASTLTTNIQVLPYP